jgi:hypothetical protein
MRQTLVPFVLFSLSLAVPVQAHGAPDAPLARQPAAAPSAAATVAIVELELVKVLALSQSDSRAVLALPDKQMVVVKAGEPVPRTRAVLTQVMADKIVMDETSADGKSRQLVWMHKGQGATPGRIDRFATQAAPNLSAPAPVHQTHPLKPGTPTHPAAAAGKP